MGAFLDLARLRDGGRTSDIRETMGPCRSRCSVSDECNCYVDTLWAAFTNCTQNEVEI